MELETEADGKLEAEVQTETIMEMEREVKTQTEGESVERDPESDTRTGEVKRERETEPVRVCVSGSTPLLWRSADLRLVRERMGIVGTLVGSLARQPRQNCRLGRPLQLQLEEARLLKDTGRAVLVKGAESECDDDRVNVEVEESYTKHLQHSYEEQGRLALEEKKRVLERVMTERFRDDALTDQPIRERLSSLKSSFSFPRSAMMVQLCTARARLGYAPVERDWLAADWTLPRDNKQEVRYRVYQDLRQQGYYITSAGKFGGDYLIYPGDPLRFHAHFIAVCVPIKSESPISDFLCLARLGANVKKTILLCSPSETESEGVIYTSIQWSGMV
ncbi:tRNA-splicing endonuclease subunit Sen34-like [Acipenser ruthenus]|uniref:tRNA-splicing endonuclease subunit Sen34-like n=1 Tax=Acipenser ruthenus TaxID=7906 RepID=UPI002740A296|nr:tRNA-splicing endonuclease subunit Sen34-like [Acipenser ruthenus]XP_033883856.3 tRNA-splicing endonuclease subunit Sen34-like [Acipenser ruthenus]